MPRARPSLQGRKLSRARTVLCPGPLGGPRCPERPPRTPCGRGTMRTTVGRGFADMTEHVGQLAGDVRGRITVGVGRRFLPLPRAQLLRGTGDGKVAVLPAAPGTPVHAIAAG